MSLRSNRLRFLLLVLLLACAGAASASKNRVAYDANGQPVHVAGSVVMIEPDIELSEVLAGGVQEPRREWSETRAPACIRRKCIAACRLAARRRCPTTTCPTRCPPTPGSGRSCA
jgi:hypothetical protein